MGRHDSQEMVDMLYNPTLDVMLSLNLILPTRCLSYEIKRTAKQP